MNKYIVTSLLCAIAASTVQADEIWVNGVTKENGWYDANKTKEDNPVLDGYGTPISYPKDPTGLGANTDDKMCYAAAAANVLAWWQDQFIIPDTVPQGVDSIWNTFVSNSTEDSGNSVPNAIEWWLTGHDNQGILSSSHTGYFSQYTAGKTIYDPENGNTFVSKIANPTTDDIIAAMSSGKAVTLATSSHSITLWGIEYDNGVISKFWVTDSDDYTMKPELIEARAIGTDGNYKIKLDDKDYEVTAAFTIDPTVSEKWGMEKKSSDGTIPEPTTVTLSLLALAALCARHRRQ